MRRALTVGAALAVVISAAACVGGPPPPPPPSDPRDVLVIGDSVAFQVGCYLGDNGEVPQVPCSPPPGADWSGGTENGALGACSVSLGKMLLYTGQLVTEQAAACGDFVYRFNNLIQTHDPKVVVLLTGGWEIIDRWHQDQGFFGSDGNWAPSPTHQWGFRDENTNGVEITFPVTARDQQVVNAINRYSERVQAAINISRSRGAHVLVVNSAYVNPPCPVPAHDPIHHAWWEAYLPSPPVNASCPLPNSSPEVFVPTTWDEPNSNGTPYRSSKVKIDQFNFYIQVIKDVAYGHDPNVEVYNNHQWFTVGGAYSGTICPAPNPPGSNPASCPDGQPAVQARAPDGGHMSPDGLEVIGCALIPRIRQILGLAPGSLPQCQTP